MRKELNRMYDQACGFIGYDRPEVPKELVEVDRQQRQLIIDNWVSWLEQHKHKEFTNTDYYENPSYYGHQVSFNGIDIDGRDFDAIDCLDFFYTDLEQNDYQYERNWENIIGNFDANTEKCYGIKLLVDPKTLDADQLYVWNEAIMSEEDWDTITMEISQSDSDFVWNEVTAYAYASCWNILDGLHDHMRYWDQQLEELNSVIDNANKDIATMTYYKIALNQTTDWEANVVSMSDCVRFVEDQMEAANG